jgi:hypothetical protein
MTSRERHAIPPLTHYTPDGGSRVELMKRLLTPRPTPAARLAAWLKGWRAVTKRFGTGRRRPWRRGPFARSSA